MAMLITKFHRLIQNRLIWLGFLIVVIFSFVIWGTQMPDKSERGPAAAGKLAGQEISIEQYQRARFNTYLSLVLMSGRAITITPEIEEQLHQMAWQRIAALEKAEALGITASNDDVVNAIRSFEFLQQNGAYSAQAYEQFAQQFLAQLRASKRDFEEHVRQEIVLNKLRVIMDRLLLVTPTEVTRTFDTLTDTFDIEYVQLLPSLVENEVTVSDDDVRALFDKEPEQFTLAEKVKVKAAVFPVADFREKAVITDDEIEEYYDFNLDKFAIKSAETNENESTNLFSTATTYRPIEEVREEIKSTLQDLQAVILAQARADEFVQELSHQRKGGRAAFDKVAAEKGLEIILTDPFTMRAIPPELADAGIAVSRAAFNLTDDDDYYYSDAITGTNFIYVLGLVERQPERVPEFEEVKDDVARMAREFAAMNALSEKAEEIRESAVAGLSAGLSFSEVLAEYKLTSEKPAPFTMNTAELDEAIASDLIRHILVLNGGEVSKTIETDTGILIGFVKSRTPGVEAIETLRPQIVSTLRRQTSPVTFQEMQSYLLKQGNFEDLMRRDATTTEDDETTDDNGA
jgi:hypothetical protein